ncbi:glycosyltransferase family 2 protein [Candidatus Daviesbacteria bacterium]|nr:glycosyltransferase family 2 protein [Candidatus Daviesbacteria bacterium]
MTSAVLVNFNEAEKLKQCFKSLAGFADEIVVVDLGSTDQSIIVCKEYGAKVFKHGFVPFVEKVRNFAVSKAVGEWILVLDPDEVVSEALKDKLKQVISEGQYQAVDIPRKNIFFGRWIAHTNWWPDKHVRFFKKGQVSWGDKIHSYPEVSGKVLDLEAREDLAIRHFGYETVAEFFKRQNRYSSIEAENLFSQGARFSWVSFVWKPKREFLVRFIRHAGFLDGFHGLALTILMMVFQLQVMVKLWELERQEK